MRKIIKIILIFILSLSLSGCSILSGFSSFFSNIKEEKMIAKIVSDNPIPDFEDRYYLSQLKDKDLAFVIIAYEGLMNFKEKIDINLTFDSQQRPLELLELIQYDCPEIYQFTTNGSTNVTFNWILSKDELVSMDITYLMNEEQYNLSYPVIQDKIQNLLNEIKSLNDFDKELYVYDYIVDTCSYNENTIHYSSPYGVLIEQEAACLGFSRTMQWILKEAGMDCITVGGYSKEKESGHAWNILKLEDEYYSLDLTADTNRKENNGYKMYLYFNVTDDFIRKDYQLQSSLFNVPETKGTKYNYYIYTDHYVYNHQDYQTKINDILSQTYLNQNKECVIQFEDKETYEEVLSNISSVYSNWLMEMNLSFIPASFANVEEYNVIYFQFN